MTERLECKFCGGAHRDTRCPFMPQTPEKGPMTPIQDTPETQETRQEWYGLSHLREIIDSRTIGGGDIAVLEDAYSALSEWSSPREPQKDETRTRLLQYIDELQDEAMSHRLSTSDAGIVSGIASRLQTIANPLGLTIDPNAPSLNLTLYPEPREPHAALIAEKLKGYVGHKLECERVAGGYVIPRTDKSCTCGLDELLTREPQPNLSAAVQTLEKLVEKWRERGRNNINRRDQSEEWMLVGVEQDRCADELSEALAHLRQREDTTP